jgi:hypothetical protein
MAETEKIDLTPEELLDYLKCRVKAMEKHIEKLESTIQKHGISIREKQ